ncbi:MAG: zinc-binding dehydrogenase [Planctomycetes bacterium]|nr:zinc-binding dehydrogenase [Planctomycetota bacterium]
MDTYAQSPGEMTAAVLTAPRQMRIDRCPIPSPTAAQVRVKLQGCGLCASNIPSWQGREWFSYPMAPGGLGHEAWGIVDAVGANVRNLQVGDRVTMLSGHAYAQYDVAPASQVVHLPASLNNRPFPGEPLGCVMNILARSGIKRGQNVAIVGIGFLGAALTQLAVARGANVIAVAGRPFSHDVAARMRAAHVLHMHDHAEVIERVKHITKSRCCDVVIECTGQQEPLNLSTELCRIRGRLVIAGYHQDGLRQVNMQLWNWRGLDVINAHERDPQRYVRGIRQAVVAVMEGLLDPWALVTHQWPLEEISTAMRTLEDRPDGFLKGIVVMSPPARELA